MESTEQPHDLLALTTEIVAAHVSNNNVAVSDLPTLINQIYNSLANIGAAPAAPAARPQPAISVKKSVQPDYIVCLEDGKKLKMLKRHLKTAYNMTPDAYRERWACRRIIRWLRRIARNSAAASREMASARALAEPSQLLRLQFRRLGQLRPG